MDENGNWTVSPAYDLTFSSGPAGHQSMLVAGEGQNPGIKDLLKLTRHTDFAEKEAMKVIDQVRDALAEWPTLARIHGVSSENQALIKGRLVFK